MLLDFALYKRQGINIIHQRAIGIPDNYIYIYKFLHSINNL